MSHVTQGQAKSLKELGFTQECEWKYVEDNATEDGNGKVRRTHEEYALPSAEELMEWLKINIPHRPSLVIANLEEAKWKVGDFGYATFESQSLIDALYLCACWVLEGKK